MEQVNLYEALNISSSLSVEELQSELLQLERVWHQREINQPEKAHKMLALIDEARVAFKSDATKAEYDHNLAESKKTPKPVDYDAESEEEFKKYFAQVEQYANSNQYDLGKLALERALPLLECDTEDKKVTLYCYAIMIYLGLEQGETALDFASKAIFEQPDNLSLYYNRALCYQTMMANAGGNNSALLDQFQNSCEIWLNKALNQHDDMDSGDMKSAAQALTFLAHIYLSKGDYLKSEEAARLAILHDPDNADEAKKYYDYINSPEEVNIDELSKYESEPNLYANEIQRLIGELLSSNMQQVNVSEWCEIPNDGQHSNSYGFPPVCLVTEDHLIDIRHKIPENYLRECERLGFCISSEGKFMAYDFSYSLLIRAGDIQKQLTKEYAQEHLMKADGVKVTVLDDIAENMFLAQFDFNESIKYQYSATAIGSSSLVGAKQDNATSIKLVRQTKKKGFGLYSALKQIIDSHAEQIEAAKKAKEQFDAEVVSMKEQTAQEFSQKRTDLISEMHQSVNEAAKNDVAIQNANAKLASANADYSKLNNQYSSMNAEYSKLGLFSGKRKKELQAQMAPLKRQMDALQAQVDTIKKQLSGMQSSEQVRQSYEKRIASLESEEKSAVMKAEQALRAKYQLPQG